MSGTLLLRVDVEHVEAARWAGAGTIEAPAARRMLDLLDRAGATASFAFVGLTAAEHPDLVAAARAAGHAVLGHSMRHAASYRGMAPAEQRRDLHEMVATIQQAGGGTVRGLAAPCHGEVDAATLAAGAAVGIEYVLNYDRTVPGGAFAPDSGSGVLLPPAAMRVVWDWTHLQPGWPRFDHGTARQVWGAAFADGGLVELIVHPWIVATNDEWSLLEWALDAAGDAGLRSATFEELTWEVAACA